MEGRNLPQCLSDRKKHSGLDLVVVLVIASAILFAGSMMVFEKRMAPRVAEHAGWLNALGVVESAFLVFWMFRGGATSPLWRWLPPFCAFPKVMWVRWFVVFAMLLGTILGVIMGKP